MSQCPCGEYPRPWPPQSADGPPNLGAGSGLKPDGAREALVLLRVVVLQADLQLHCLQNLLALALVPLQDFPHHQCRVSLGDFAAHGASGHNNQMKEQYYMF